MDENWRAILCDGHQSKRLVGFQINPMDVKPTPNNTFKISAILVVLILLGLQIYILFGKDVTSIGSDEWNWIPLVRDAYAGEFDFQNYWKAHGGHRVFGYKVLFTLNALFLGLDLRYFQYGGVLLWTLGALVGAFWLNKKLSFGRGFFPIFAAIMIVTTLISPHAWVNSDYSLISWRLGNILGFMLIFIFVDKLIYEDGYRKNLIWFTLLVFIYTLFFGRGWGQAMLYSSIFFLSLATLTFLKLKIYRKVKWLTAAISVGIITLLIYNSGSQPLVAPAKEPISISGFYNFTTGLMGNTLGYEFVGRQNFQYRDLIRSLGVFSIMIYAIACLFYIKTSLFKKTTFPLLIMCFSTVAIIAAYFGRGLAIGESAAYYPRWVAESCLGLAGAIAILFHARHEAAKMLTSGKTILVVNSTLSLACGFIFVTHTFAINSNITSVKSIHRYDERSLKGLYSIPENELKSPQTPAAKKTCSRKIRCKFRPFLDQHNLVPGRDRYRPKPDADKTQSP